MLKMKKKNKENTLELHWRILLIYFNVEFPIILHLMTFCFETFFGDFPGKKNLSGKIIWRNDLERCQNINMFIQCCFLAQQLAEDLFFFLVS